MLYIKYIYGAFMHYTMYFIYFLLYQYISFELSYMYLEERIHALSISRVLHFAYMIQINLSLIQLVPYFQGKKLC